MVSELTHAYVRSLFGYRDGELYRKVRRGSRGKIGSRVGNSTNHGYRQTSIDSKKYYIHRLIFLYHHGYIPEFIDHIDGDRSNNDIDNLRPATSSQNQVNRKKCRSINGEPTSSGFKGVHWHKFAKKWRSQIKIGDKRKHLGYFILEIDAAKAYYREAIELHGEFAKVNFD